MLKSSKIYIYGTGGGAEKLYNNRQRDGVKIIAFIDSDPAKWGNRVPFANEYLIIGPADIREPYDKVVIASVYSEVYEYLKKQGISDDKIILLNDYANNDIIEKKSHERYNFLCQILNEQYINALAKVRNVLPMGNHSSPIVNISEVRKREKDIFHISAREDMQIDLHMSEQIFLLEQFSEKGDILPFHNAEFHNMRFHQRKDNDMFSASAAHVLSHMIVHFNTKRIIEVGSGFSSAAMLDIQERVDNSILKLTFIEPYPARLKALLRDGDNVTLYEQTLQEVDLNIFQELEANDILFIDSSHVVKTGNDVNVILFQILPLLNKGVIIHFHDIPFPFEYPKKWVYEGRNWNEVYIIRAFLQYNNMFRILFWEDSIRAWNEEGLITLRKNVDKKLLSGSSLYMRKV